MGIDSICILRAEVGFEELESAMKHHDRKRTPTAIKVDVKGRFSVCFARLKKLIGRCDKRIGSNTSTAKTKQLLRYVKSESSVRPSERTLTQHESTRCNRENLKYASEATQFHTVTCRMVNHYSVNCFSNAVDSAGCDV